MWSWIHLGHVCQHSVIFLSAQQEMIQYQSGSVSTDTVFSKKRHKHQGAGYFPHLFNS